MLISPSSTRPGVPHLITAQVIFGHPASGNQTSFLEEAKELASLGIRSWLLDFEFEKKYSDPANLTDPQREIAFRKKCIEKVTKASLHLGNCAPQIYVGKNFGAFIGGMAASQETYISRFILAAGIGDLTDFYVSSEHEVARRARTGISESQLRRYEVLTREWNPINLLPQAKGKEVYFQFGSQDSWIPKSAALKFVDAAPGFKQLHFYEDGHDLEIVQARLDRKQFILDFALNDVTKNSQRPGLKL